MGSGASAVVPSTAGEKAIPSSVRDQVQKNIQLLNSDKAQATKNLYNLCYDVNCKEYMGYPSLGVLGLLPMSVRDENATVRSYGFYIIMTLALNSSNSSNLTSPSLGLLAALNNAGRNLKGDDQLNAWKCIGNICGNFSPSANAMRLIDAESHLVALELIKKAGPNLEDKPEFAYIQRCLSTILRICCLLLSDVNAKLKEANVVDAVLPIARNPKNKLDSLRAVMIVILLIGRDEAKVKNGVSTNVFDSQHVTILRDKYQTILENKDDEGNVSGKGGYSFSPYLLLQAINCMCISDTNRDKILNGHFLPLLMKGLQRFVDNAGPLGNEAIRIGGGGADTTSAGLAIDSLLQLSFAYESDMDLQTKFMTPSTGLLALLNALLLNTNLKKNEEYMRNVRLLIQRLTSVPVVEPAHSPTTAAAATVVAASSHAKASHIMMSYCWNKDAKPGNVSKLGTTLRELGYDVWRDEEGSSLVPGMTGSTDERMGEALDAASFVIMVVSKPYKESSNCRMEASYANQLQKKGKTKIIFVMAQQNYTTVSSPYCCDGWLGVTIGDALWYPLWDDAQIRSTANEIIKIIGNNTARMSINREIKANNSTQQVVHALTEPVTSHAAAAPTTPGKDNEINHEAAFDILKDTSNATDEDGLVICMDDLGIKVSSDLLELEKEDLLPLAGFLKTVPKKKLLKFLKLN